MKELLILPLIFVAWIIIQQILVKNKHIVLAFIVSILGDGLVTYFIYFSGLNLNPGAFIYFYFGLILFTHFSLSFFSNKKKNMVVLSISVITYFIGYLILYNNALLLV